LDALGVPEGNPHPALSLEKGEATEAPNRHRLASNLEEFNMESTNSQATVLLAAKC